MFWNTYIVLCLAQGAGAAMFSASDVTVHCHNNRMDIVIDNTKLQDVNQSGQIFRLADGYCEAKSNGSYLIASTAFDGCGTNRTTENGKIRYKNILSKVLQKNWQTYSDTPCPVMDIHVSCWFPDIIKKYARIPRSAEAEKVVFCKEHIALGPQIEDGILANTKLSSVNLISVKSKTTTCPLLIGVGEELEPDRVLTYTKITSPQGVAIKQKKFECSPPEGTGNLNIKMSIYTDQTYSFLLPAQQKVQRSEYYDDVFYEISLVEPSNMNIIATTCFATPYPNPNTKMRYVFFKDGCALDDTYMVHPSKTGKYRFSITSFKFISSNSQTFYVHCEVLVCDEERGQFCNAGCDNNKKERLVRKKRSLRAVSRRATLEGVNTVKIFRKAKILSKNIVKQKISFHYSGKKKYILFAKHRNVDVLAAVTIERHTSEKKLNAPLKMKIRHSTNKWWMVWQLNSEIRKDIIQVNQCYFGTSRLRRRQTQFISDGCVLGNFSGVTMQRYGNSIHIIGLNNMMKSTQKYFMTCEVTVCSKHDPSCKRNACQNLALKRNVRSVSGIASSAYLECKPNSMIFTVRKPVPGNTPIKRLHLIDPECKAKENSTHVILTTQTNKCGTTLSRKGHFVEYTNALVGNPWNSLIIRRNTWKIPFRCTYNLRPLTRAISVNYKTSSVKFRSHAFGTYKVDISLYSDGNYTEKKTNQLLGIDSDEHMYFEVMIKSAQLNLALFLDKCFGVPLYRTARREEYAFIENGCGTDDTLKFYETDDLGKIRFSLKPFTFADNSGNVGDGSSNVVINCYVTACNRQDENSKCHKGCHNNED